MSNVPAKFASAVLLSVVVGAVAVALPSHRAKAADGCQTEPGDGTPQGKHWHYRTERSTGRHCWYLRGEAETSAPEDTQDAAPPEKPVARRQNAVTTGSIANAHAEIAPRTSAPEETAAAPPSVWPNPAPAAATVVAPDNALAATADTTAAAAPLASRRPQTSSAAPSNPAAAPSNAAPDASLMVADAEPDPNANASAQQPSVPPPPIATAPPRDTGSIQKLLLVAFGALALAGLTGSAVYRLGRRRRRDDWLRERTDWQSSDNPHNPPWVEPNRARPASQTLDLDELAAAPQSDLAPTMAESEYSDARVEKIEEFLARLTKQLHEEFEGTGRAERDARAAS
jgi:hypothetical protein